MFPISRVLAAAVLAVAPAALAAQAASSKEAVLATAQAFFDAMGRKDTAALRELVHPQAHLMAVVEVADSAAPRVSSRDQFLAQVAAAQLKYLERMWNAEVRVSGPIASIWTPYDFHRGTEWSHCGIDSFQLVKNGVRWQISSIIYTVVPARDRCKNPLGPPR